MDQIYEIVQNITQLDVSNISLLLATLASVGYSAFKQALQPIWLVIEKPLGFALSSLVVVSLWVALLRIHVSLSFNVDSELFDNLLWLSAITYTPYYVIKYGLTERLALFFVRTVELVVDLLVWSWFEEKASANRIKWRKRFAPKSFNEEVTNFLSIIQNK